MADFKVKICQLDEVSAHPNADRLDLARIGGWQVVVGKNQHKAGELVAYIPEQSLVPEKLQQILHVEGKLAGSRKNRVKALRLRGVLSQGLILPLKESALRDPETGETKLFRIGEDAKEFLGITKYEPPIPIQMSGEVYSSPLKLPRYDVENWKSDPEAILPGTPVLVTEKLHGTLCLVIFYEDQIIISSKGLSGKDMALKESDKNLYHQSVKPYLSKFKSALRGRWPKAKAVGVIGEIIGRKVQDLHYGLNKPEFYLFEIVLKHEEQGPWEYQNFAQIKAFAKETGLNFVPFLGETTCPGPKEIARAEELADGKSAISSAKHIREGVVLRTAVEARDQNGDRSLRKIVSGAYLTRKKGTEHR